MRAPLIASLVLCHAAAAAELELQLKANVEQTTMTLSVRDVVESAGDDVAGPALLAAALPEKGRVGETVAYTRADVERVLAARATAPLTVRWRGAPRVLVIRRGDMLEPATYVAWARERLFAHLASDGERIELQPAGTYRAVAIPAGERAIEARFAATDIGRSARVWLDVAVDGRFYTTLAVAFDVRRFARALALKQDGAKHQALAPEQVAEITGAVSSANGRAVTDPRRLEGQRLRHPVAAGVPLGEADIEPRPAVTTGADVQVFASVGRVVVQTRASAERDGRIGERIRVLVPNNNERLAVEVIGENRAMVTAP